MAYEFERDEWRGAVRQLTEADRYINANQARWARGLIGEPEDVLDDNKNTEQE